MTITFPTFVTPSRLAKLNQSSLHTIPRCGSHNKHDARDTGIDAQQLVEFVVDDAPTVVQLLAQVYLPFLPFLPPLILTYI